MNLDGQLTQLEAAQLVRHLTEDEPAFIFKHALTQEAAYDSLLLRSRRDLHRSVAETYEKFYAQELDELAALIAYHFAKAGDDAKAFEYATRAGDVAARRSGNAVACLQYDMALEALARLAGTTDHRRERVDTILKRVNVSLRAEGPYRTLERLREAESLAEALAASGNREDRLRLARVRYWMAQGYLHGGQTQESMSYMRQVLEVANAEQGEVELRAIPESMLGRALVAQGRFAEAEPHLRVAADLLDPLATNHEWVMAVGALGVLLAARGDYAAGIAENERARLVALQVNNLTALALCSMWRCCIYMLVRDSVALEQESEASIRTAEKTGDRLVIYTGYGLNSIAQSRLGEHAAAFESMTRSKTLGEKLGQNLVFGDWFAAASAEIALNAGQIENALGLAEQAAARGQQMGGLLSQGLAHRVWGQALAAHQPPRSAEAEKHFVESLRLFEAGQARLEAACTHLAWGKMLRERGDADSARQHLAQAAAQFEASGLTRELKEARRLMPMESVQD